MDLEDREEHVALHSEVCFMGSGGTTIRDKPPLCPYGEIAHTHVYSTVISPALFPLPTFRAALACFVEVLPGLSALGFLLHPLAASLECPNTPVPKPADNALYGPPQLRLRRDVSIRSRS